MGDASGEPRLNIDELGQITQRCLGDPPQSPQIVGKAPTDAFGSGTLKCHKKKGAAIGGPFGFGLIFDSVRRFALPALLRTVALVQVDLERDVPHIDLAVAVDIDAHREVQ